MITDSEWRRIGERARAAGMPVSRYIAHRLAGPEEALPEPEPWTGLLRRVAREAMILSRIEELRLANNGEQETWAAVAAEVDAVLATEESVG